MPRLTLLGDRDTSPYCCKVRIILGEKNLPYEYVSHALAQGGDNPVLRHNPLGLVPVLVIDDQDAVFDSRVIVEFLECLATSPVLLPSGLERAAVRRWEALGDGICDAGRTCKHENKRADTRIEVVRKQTVRYERGLERASQLLGRNTWCHGNAYSLADIAIGTALAWIGAYAPDNDPRDRYPNLKALYERLMQRPAFETATLPFNKKEGAHAAH